MERKVQMNQFFAMHWVCSYHKMTTVSCILIVLALYTQALNGWGLSMRLA